MGRLGWRLLAWAAISDAKTPDLRDHPRNTPYNCQRLASAPVLDGDHHKDWPAELPMLSRPPFEDAAGKAVFFESHNGGKWDGPKDHAVKVTMGWTSDALYALVHVLDDSMQSNCGSGNNFVWDGDSLQLLITDFQDATFLYNVALYPKELGCDGEVHVQYEQLPAGVDTAETPLEAAVVRLNRAVTAYEVRIPARLLGVAELSKSSNLGIALGVNDGDQTPGQEGQRGWSGVSPDAIVFNKDAHKAMRLSFSDEITPRHVEF